MILTKNYNFIVGQDMLNLIYCMTEVQSLGYKPMGILMQFLCRYLLAPVGYNEDA